MQASLILLTFDLINVFLLIKLVLGYEIRKRRSLVIAGLILLAADYAVGIVFKGSVDSEIFLFINVMFIMAIPALIFEGKWTSLAGISICFCMLMNVATDIVWGYWFVSWGGETEIDLMNVIALRTKAISAILMVVTYFFVRTQGKKLKTVVDEIHPLVFVLIWILMVLLHLDWSYLGAIDANSVEIVQGRYIAKAAITSLVITSMTVLFLIISYQRKSLKREVALIEKCIDEQTVQHEFMETANTKTQRFRREFNNHIDEMVRFADEGNMKDLIEYIRKLTGVKEKFYYISTGNIVCDAIFNQYYTRCIESGITLEVIGAFPEGLSVTMTDLCVVLSNALDNAYNAALQCDEDKRKIKCKVGNHGNLILITISNPVAGPLEIENGKIVTSEKPSDYHGYGMQNMLEAAERCGGTVIWNYQNDLVITEICVRGNKDATIIDTGDN